MIQVRDAEPRDAPVLVALIVELGHPTDPATVARQIAVLDASPHDRVVAADEDGRVLGMAGMHIAIFSRRCTTTERNW